MIMETDTMDTVVIIQVMDIMVDPVVVVVVLQPLPDNVEHIPKT
jgi:hypothetical protein